MSEQVKRYDPAEVLTDRWEMGSMEEAADGDYVRWDDYEREVRCAIAAGIRMQDKCDALHAEAEALQRQVTELTNQRDAILLQARCWAGEAKTQQAITKAVGEALGGVPGWGPIAAGVEAPRAEQGERQEAVAVKSHGACDGLDDLDNLPDGTMLFTTPQPGPDVRGLVRAGQQMANSCYNLSQFEIIGDTDLKSQLRDLARGWDETLTAHRQAQRKGESHDT